MNDPVWLDGDHIIDCDDEPPSTVPYPSSAPISAVRVMLRDESRTCTLRCAELAKPRTWPTHLTRLTALSVLAALTFGLPGWTTLGVIGSTLVLVLLARRT